MRPHRTGRAEQLGHLLGPGRGCQVDVVDRLAQEPIAHGAADEIYLMAGRAEPPDDRVPLAHQFALGPGGIFRGRPAGGGL
jgi:hypothetical protein